MTGSAMGEGLYRMPADLGSFNPPCSKEPHGHADSPSLCDPEEYIENEIGKGKISSG